MSGWRAAVTFVLAVIVAASWAYAVHDEPVLVANAWHRGSFALALLAYFVMFPGPRQRGVQWSAILGGVALWIVVSRQPFWMMPEVTDGLRATVVVGLGLGLVIVAVPTISQQRARVVATVVGLCAVSLFTLREYFWATVLLTGFIAIVVFYHFIEAARAIIEHRSPFEPSPIQALGAEPMSARTQFDEPMPRFHDGSEPVPRTHRSRWLLPEIWLMVSRSRSALQMGTALLARVALAILLILVTRIDRLLLAYAVIGGVLAGVWLLVAVAILHSGMRRTRLSPRG